MYSTIIVVEGITYTIVADSLSDLYKKVREIRGCDD